MGTTTVAPTGPAKVPANAAKGQQGGIEKRRRRRAKISAQVFVRAVETDEPFEEVCMTVDVSRDGILFTTDSPRYQKGQRLDVTFPYSNMTGAINTGQPAEVVRLVPQPGGKNGIALQFLSARAET